jgi:Arc/MetJ family transcription regulator
MCTVIYFHTHFDGTTVRTNIVIDDQLMQAAMTAGNFKTKKDAVEEGLRLLARRKVYQDLRALRGKIHWTLEGDWTQQERSAQEPQADWSEPAEKTPE